LVVLRTALPKGHLWNSVCSLLEQAGYGPKLSDERSYVVKSRDPDLEMRLYRAQNIGPLVEEGKYDLGITGIDWIREPESDVAQLLDLGVGKVDVVVAIPQRYGVKPDLEDPKETFRDLAEKLRQIGRKRVIAASEYENLTKKLCQENLGNMPWRFIRSYGATETFVEVADLIIDNSETGATLRQNGWVIVYTLFSSTAVLIANKQSLEDSWKKDKIEDLTSLIQGAIDARGLKLLKMNVSEKVFPNVMKVLPAMKSPTISRLHGNKEPGYAVEVAVKEDQIVQLIPLLKKKGATDILEIDLKKVVR
jgi:ATP phosphoribosyltransferase